MTCILDIMNNLCKKKLRYFNTFFHIDYSNAIIPLGRYIKLAMLSRKVCYLYNEDITSYQFGKQHPMKTKRIKMAHSLIHNYNLTPHLSLYHPKHSTVQQLASFHHPSYIQYLQSWVSPNPQQIVQQYHDQNEAPNLPPPVKQDFTLGSIFKINQTPDCPGFQGLFDFCRLAAGSSIDAADLIIAGMADVSINWSGGFHHAKKSQASGFCYVNDIVLCILQLLKVYPRVLYLDIDVHHGDGVEEAFYHTNRVMTVSFHQYQEEFFPGTGALEEVGEGIGKYFTVNVPLRRGINDQAYLQLFKKVMGRIMASFVPDVLVIQCGADSLSRDKLGHLNLSIKGHGQLLTFMKGYGTPIVLLGGGGYTIQNVARCWAYQTGLMLGKQIQDTIPPFDPYYKYYQQGNHKIHFQVEPCQNMNPTAYCEMIYQTVCQNLRESQIRPSISFHSAPRAYMPTQENDWEVVEDDSMVDQACQRFFKKL